MTSASRVSVIGLGYVGLPAAACLARAGLEVIGVDIDPVIVDLVNRGQAPVCEPGLAELVARTVADGRLKAITSTAPADAYIIAVPTPLAGDAGTGGAGTGVPDVSFVEAAAAAVAEVLSPGECVIVESTVPPGTTRRVAALIAGLRPDLRVPGDVVVAHCPERVLPGRVLAELTTGDRLIGGLTPEDAARVAPIYSAFCTGELIMTDADSAELAKLAENAFRDVNIAFANELANVCDQLGLDVWEIRRLANRHPRVSILRPGPGVGGHCIAVDPWFIAAAAPDATPLIQAARLVNDARPAQVASRIEQAARQAGATTIGCLGLAFKANVSDLRCSPAIEIVKLLATAGPGITILVADPYVATLPQDLAGFPNVTLMPAKHVLESADLVALLVDHSAFGDLAPNGKPVIDTRGITR